MLYSCSMYNKEVHFVAYLLVLEQIAFIITQQHYDAVKTTIAQREPHTGGHCFVQSFIILCVTFQGNESLIM